MNDNKTRREVWALAETKETAVGIFQELIVSQSDWLKAVHGYADPSLAKTNFVISMYAAYQIASPSFHSYLKRIISQDKYEQYVNNYRDLGLKGTKLDTDSLYDLSSHLHEWYVSEGYARLNDNIREVDNPLDEVELLDNAK